MKYTISLMEIPDWARYDLLNSIEKKVKNEQLDVEIPDINLMKDTQSDVLNTLIIVGTQASLTLLIPFIYDWLIRKRVKCELKEENGVMSIIVSGYDTKRVIEVKKELDIKK